MLSLYAGKAETAKSDLRVRRPDGTDLTLQDVPWQDRSFASPIYYGYLVTHWPSSESEWGLALDFSHAKIHLEPSDIVGVDGTRAGAPVGGQERIDRTMQEFNLSHGHNFLTINALGRKKWGENQFILGGSARL